MGNYFAIGTDELGGPIERRMKCPHCGDFHAVKDSERSEIWDSELQDWKPGRVGVLQYYECGDRTFLAGIEGKALPE
jgi:hypothetical protein